MTRIQIETPTQAPPERLFDLARSQSVHVASASRTRERVVAGPEHDLLALGDTVTFEAVHFGIRQRATARIVEFDRPHRFVDEMVESLFRSFRHEHLFEAGRMIDSVEFEMPTLLRWTEGFVAAHLRKFLQERGLALNQMAQKT